MRGFLAAALLWCIAIIFPAAAQDMPVSKGEPQVSIWEEARVGHVVAGPPAPAGGNPLAYAYYFAAIGPKPGLKTKPYGDCLERAAYQSAEKFRADIEYNIGTWPDQDLFDDAQAGRTAEALNSARALYRDVIRKTCAAVATNDPFRGYIDGTRLALVKRECQPGKCVGLEPTGLPEQRRRARAFEAIYFWAVKSNVDRALNQVVVLDLASNSGLDARSIETKPGYVWPSLLAPAQTQRAFEERVSRSRRPGRVSFISVVVPVQIGLPKKTVLRVASAFENASVAYDLAPDAAEVALSVLQDESARIRLHECRTYRDNGPLSEVAKCAGYILNEQQLIECLNGAACMPKFAANAEAGAILMSSRLSVNDLAHDSFVPRPFSELQNSFGTVVDSFSACAAGRDVSRADVMDAIKVCVGQKQIPPKLEQQAKCLLTKATKDRLRCVVDGDARKALDRYQACTSGPNKNCALQAALPPNLACVPGAKSVADLTCLAGGKVADAAKAAQCLSNSKLNYVERVTCVGGDKLPPDVKKVMSCYSAGASEAAMAVCVLGKGLPPKQALYIRCAVESGGDYLAAGVCVAAPLLKLNGGQQILLQCAMASGGVPVTFAACTIGQFTFQELQKCKKVEFGKSGCFGPNNEFQRLAKALTGKAISKSSVVGQVAVHSIDSANAAFSGAGNVLSEIGKGAKNTEEGFRRELKHIEDNPIKAAANAPFNIARETGKGIENIGKEGGRAYKKHARKLKDWVSKI